MTAPSWLHGLLAAALGAATLLCAAELRAEWTEVATLLRPADLGGDGKNFGERGLACGGGSVLVGASGEDSFHGAVYAFSGPDFASVQRLTVPEEYTIGSSLAISGDTALVGSSQIDNATVSVFVQRDGVWTLQQTIEPSGDARYGAFGKELGLHADLAVISSPKEAGDLGRIHVYRRSGGVWSEEAVLAASDGSRNDFFSLGFGFQRDTLIAGAPTNPLDDSPRGAAYIFALSEGAWSQEARFDLSGQDPSTPAIYFGGNAAIDGDWAVASGAKGTDVVVEPRYYLYQRSGGTWQHAQTIVLPVSQRPGPAAIQRDRLFISGTDEEYGLLQEYRLSDGQWSLQQAFPGATITSRFAVCGSTLVRSDGGAIIVYRDAGAGVDPTVLTATGASGSNGQSQGKSGGGGCSLWSAPSSASYPSGIGLALLLLLAVPRLRRSRA